VLRLNIEKKIAALERVYRIYEEISDDASTACRPGCAHCCTAKVWLTTLEGYHLLHGLGETDQKTLMDKLRTVDAADRYRPPVTTNQLASLCAAGREPPPDSGLHRSLPCPLLADDLCSFYALRPFNCRCFVSRIPCGAAGYADVDDYTLSLNTLFLQTLEHLDRPGCSGSLPDVVTALESDAHRRAYQRGQPVCERPGILKNQPMTALMVPPQQRRRMAPVIERLASIRL
jgi:Fe-S-cluster containining protein